MEQVASLSLTLADASAAVSADPATQAITGAAEEVVSGSKSGGFFGPIAALFETILKVQYLRFLVHAVLARSRCPCVQCFHANCWA